MTSQWISRRRMRLAITLAAPLAGLLLAEAIVRVFDLHQPPWPEKQGGLFQDSADPILLFENRPGAVKTVSYRENKGGAARVVEHRVNEQGFRGALFALERAPDTLRIACIGDSHTFGEGVEAEQTWPAQLQRLFAERRPARRIEVMNCGVDGYDTLQEVLWMEQRVLAYSPDIVLLQYYINDTAARGLEIPAPEDALLHLSAPGRKDWVGRLRAHSEFAEFVLDGIYRRRGLVLYSDLRTRLYEPDNPGWQRVQAALLRARDGLADRNIALGVVLYPFLVERGGTLTSHAAFEIVSKFCTEQGLACLNTETEFLKHDVDLLRVSMNDYHGNAVANAIFARQVADWLEQRGLLPR